LRFVTGTDDVPPLGNMNVFDAASRSGQSS